MTTKRPLAPAISRKTNTHITRSDFVEPESKPLVVPRDCPATLRKRVRQLLDENPHLAKPQLPAVVRLAELEKRFRELSGILEERGLLVKDRFGNSRKNPAMPLFFQMQNAIRAQERDLSITVSARRENIPEGEKTIRRGGPRPGTKKNRDGTTSPKLRLA